MHQAKLRPVEARRRQNDVDCTSAYGSAAHGAMNTMCSDKFDQIMAEGRMLVINGKKSTLSSKDVETACKLTIPGELGKGAITQGRQALKERAQAGDE